MRQLVMVTVMDCYSRKAFPFVVLPFDSPRLGVFASVFAFAARRGRLQLLDGFLGDLVEDFRRFALHLDRIVV